MARKIDITGETFGRWSVIEFSHSHPKTSQQHYICVCECGAKRVVNMGLLRRGDSKSCGCLQRDALAARMPAQMTTHSESRTRLYRIWSGMIARCYNKNIPNFNDYGGRGIVMCDEWRGDYALFSDWAKKSGYDDNLSIDRRDNDGNYEPSNCRWADRQTQAVNQRIRRNNRTGYTGVYESGKRFIAGIRVGGKQKWLGTYDTAIEASKARLKYCEDNGLAEYVRAVKQSGLSGATQ